MGGLLGDSPLAIPHIPISVPSPATCALLLICAVCLVSATGKLFTAAPSLLCQLVRRCDAFLFGPCTSRAPPNGGASGDSLSDIIRRFPAHAAWFIKWAMMFGGISAIFLSIPIVVYLHLRWKECSDCPKVFGWWLMVNSALQATQAPLRFIFAYKVARMFAPAEAMPLVIAPEERRRELLWLSRKLRWTTVTPAWRISVWLSVLSYTWLLVGTVWLLGDRGCCCGTCGTVQAFSSFTLKPVLPNIETAMIAVVIISLLRVIIVLGLFYVALPSRIVPTGMLSGQYFSSDTIRFREAFATFNGEPLVHRWDDQRTNMSPSGHDWDFGSPSFDLWSSSIEEDIAALNEDDFQEERSACKGLPSAAINTLAVTYYCSEVFPNTLIRPHSCARRGGEGPHKKLGESTAKHRYEKIIGKSHNKIESSESMTDSSTLSSFEGSLDAKCGKHYIPSLLKRRDSEFLESCFPKDPFRSPKFKGTTMRSFVREGHSERTRGFKLSGERHSKRGLNIRSGSSHMSPIDLTKDLSDTPPLFFPNCSICLDDFEENCELRQLPCRHGFHRKCIDLWLLQCNRCPLCHIPILR